jgi:FAD dependent oxidoreductase TIGR03364
MTDRVVVIGGGILGTMHAWHAVKRGMHVTHVEREAGARGASVRNFGLVWVSGRAPGPELALGLRARELWDEVAADCPGTGFRPAGSLTVATDEPAVSALELAADLPDAAARGFQLLDADEARARCQALGADVLAALFCERDAIVEPRLTPAAIRARLVQSSRYTWRPGRHIVDTDSAGAIDDLGQRHPADLTVVCTGAAHRGLLGGVLDGLALRRVRLQMLETAPLDTTISTAIADADSLRYYPAFAGPPRDHLAVQDPLAEAWAAQLLLVQRLDGSLTIGDTHAHDEPFAFDYDSSPEAHLLATASRILGRPLPEVRRRWTGVYSQVTDDRTYARVSPLPGVVIVTGPGGRGMTLSPAIAEETFQ